MADALRDANQVRTLLASFSGVTTNLKIEHATGYLKVSALMDGALPAPIVVRTASAHDDNGIPTDSASFNGVATPLYIEHSSGRLRCFGM